MEGDVRIVQITIRDRQLRKLTAINNEIPEMLSFQNDTFHLYRENSTSTFDFTIPKWYNGKLHDDVRLINDDVYISFIDDDRHYYFYVHTLVQDDFNFILTCNDANLEYTMEQANPFVNSESHNIEWYLKSMDLLELANVHIGLNEISDVTRTLSFDNQETKLERLSSLISQFGGEFDLVTEVDKNGKYSGTRLDIYHEADDTHHGVGKVRGDVTLTYGKDVKGVQVTSDKDGFFNAGIFTGADGLNITDLDKSEKDADGNEEYYTRSGSPMIYAPKSRDKYPSSFLGSDKWTRRDFSTDYKDKNELYAYALRTIKQYSMPQKTYLVSAQSDMLSNVKKLSKGDTVYIYDKNFEGGLLIEARVSEVIKSFTNPMNDTYVFSNYVLINREVSATLQARIDEILASKIPYRIVMVTSNGTSFKNGTGQSIVSPKLFKGDVEITDATYRFNFNNNTVAGLNYTVNASAVNGASVLKIDAYVGNDVVASDELTFINVNDGVNGSNGRGITSTEDYYLVSASKIGITSITTGWVKGTPQVATATNKYHWHYHVDIYSDGTRKETVPAVIGIYGDQGLKGDDGLSAYTHVAYANKSTDVLVDAITTFAIPASFSGSTLTSTKISGGYKFTSTGGNSYTKQVVGFSGTTGKNVYTYLIIKNTHATNDIVVSFNGIGAVLNENFSNVTVKPGQTYVDYRPAVCRDTYNFVQVSIGSTAISNDLSYEIYDYALYNTNPFINFSLDVNPNCRFRGEYQDNNQTASTDPTKYKWSDLRGTVDVGGRNYLTKSNRIEDSGANKLGALSVRDAETPNGFKATGNSTKDGVVRLHNVINSDGWWTVSFDIKGSQSLAVNVDVDICDQGQTRIWTNATNTYERKSISVNVTNYSKNPSVYRFVDFSNFAFAYFWIDNIKIEKGNMPTDYSPAPEDVQAVIDANQALTQAQMLALEERSALARDNAIAEAMKNTISEVEAKWQTWYNLNTADEKQKVANDIASLLERVAKFEQNLGEASARFEFINNETLIGEEGVAIGDKEGKAKLFLSNDSISFVTNGVAQMTLTGDTLTIKNGLFTERIQVGNYVEEVYDRNPLYNVIRPIKYS